MFQLNKLTKLVKKRKLIGRGGSRGGTSGRGNKGQKARTGDAGVGYGFEGGQTPLARHLPKRGFNNDMFGKSFAVVNLRDLERCYNDNEEVSLETLAKNKLFKDRRSTKGEQRGSVKILGSGTITKKLVIVGLHMSASARESIERAGGKVVNN